MCKSLLALVALVAATAAYADDPSVKWTFAAQSNLYPSPLVADVHPSPGQEVIVCDSDVRTMRCVSAVGKELWHAKAGWKRRLISAPSLSFTARPGKGTLVVGNDDGTLTTLDARTGAVVWRRKIGSIEWGTAVWADLDGDGRDDVVAGTYEDGVHAFDATGRKLWAYGERTSATPISIPAPIGVADVDGDRKPEIFVVTKIGPICLGADGKRRWNLITGADWLSDAVVADADRDGKAELYCAGSDDNAAYCIDAQTGAVRWRFPMLGQADTYSSSSIAVGDLDGCGRAETVFGDKLGNVYCVDTQGRPRWSFATEKRVHAACSLGDVDGDGEIDTLVASGDHFLYCLDSRGALKWRFRAGLRIMYPATITDVDGDGRTDILFGGSDRKLRCLTLGGRYIPEMAPWPTRGFDAAQSCAAFGPKAPLPLRTVEVTEPILPNGGFELAKPTSKKEDYKGDALTVYNVRVDKPRNWHAPRETGGTWQLDSASKHGGERGLKVVPEKGSFEVVSNPLPVTHDMRRIEASVMARNSLARSGESIRPTQPGRAFLRWFGATGTLRVDELGALQADSDGWVRLAARVDVPSGARSVELALVSYAWTNVTVWWADATMVAAYVRPRSLRALVNQVGYDTNAPKRFTVQANFPAESGRFELLSATGAVVHSGALVSRGRIVGAFGHDWGWNYWRGDFSAFDKAGRYRIRVTLDGTSDVSWPFRVAPNALWTGTAQPTYRFFYYQRCGTAIPGYHKACHLDDAANKEHTKQFSLAGGWHDAGDYNKYHNAPFALAVMRYYETAKSLFDKQDVDRNGIGDCMDEALWAAKHYSKMVTADGSVYGGINSGYGYWGPPDLETDNIPGTGDERPVEHVRGVEPPTHIAAIAKAALYDRQNRAAYVAAAERAMRYAMKHKMGGEHVFVGALDLYLVTRKREYLDIARRLADSRFEAVTTCELADRLLGLDSREEMKRRMVARAEEILTLAENPFGIYTRGPKEKPNFFGTPADPVNWHIGNSSHVLIAAIWVAQAYYYNRDQRYLAFIYDQFNWVLGTNPFDMCMVEGVGSVNPPTYHQRLTFAGVPRGATPGSVVNGIAWRAVGDDRPYFDLTGLDIPDADTNEVWLPHNCDYLGALAYLMKGRAAVK